MRLVAWAGRFEPHDFEWRRRDGAVIRVRSNPMPGGGLVTTYTDITARKMSEETLLKLSSAVEQTADLVMITDHNGVIEYVNPGFEAVTGYSRAEAVGQTPRFLKSGHQDRAFYRQLWDTVLSGRVFRDVLVNQKRSGESYFEDRTITPVKDSIGTITHFVATGRDITEQKLAERAMQALIEGTAAAVGEEFFRSLVRHLAQALGVRHALIAEISGPARDRIVTRAVWSVNGFAHDFEHALAGGPCSGILRKQEYIYPQGAREAFPRDELLERMEVESFLGTSLRSSAGEVLGLLAVMDGEPMEQVVHARALLKIFGARAGAELERERAAAALHASELQLRQSQKMDAVGQLAGGIAHDFNNLLTVIGGRSALLLQRLSPTDPGRSDVELISKTANRAAQLTRQLLAFSRRQILELRVVDVNAVVTSMQSLLRRLIGEHIELTVRPDPSLARVKADPGQLEQIVMNLAVNARDAMPQGGHLTIETQNATLDAAYARSHPGAEPGPYVMLAVSDTGIGMDAETQSRVFEPFFTTKEVGKGTGLGLAMVYGIVKQSGGYIALSSELGHGTMFELYLPRVDASEEVVGTTAGSGEMPGGSEIVLLVEDEGDVRDLAREILEGLGYTVLTAGSPEDALEIGRQRREPIHLLLTDVIMPGMSGRVLADRLRAARPDLRVLYTSGYTDDAIDRHGVLDAGMAFLQKPFTPEALARKVGEVLRAAGKVGSSEL